MPLDQLAATALAGPPVTDLATAAGVDTVTAADVTSAEQTATAAEADADDAERGAVLGAVDPAEATGLREQARFLRLRAHLTAEQRKRHAAAERLRGLDHVGADALNHANALKVLRDDCLADLASINELLAGMRARVNRWNAQLREIAARGTDLDPDPIPPSGAPGPGSAHVYADQDHGVIVMRRRITYIKATDPSDLPTAIDAASTDVPGHNPEARLVLGESGLVTVMPPGSESWERRIREGTIHELTADERDAYYRGEPITWETINRD